MATIQDMDWAEVALDLGAAVVKTATQVWAGPLAGISSPIVDLVERQISNRFEQKRALRFFDRCVDTVARRLVSTFETSRLPENELNAAILAVKDTFSIVAFDDFDVIQADLNAALLEKAMGLSIATVLENALLSSRAEALYRLVLRESCAYAVEVVTTLPNFTELAIPEILKRESAILETLQRVLELLPQRRGLDDFEVDYRRLVINRFDRMELFGLRLSNEANRRYPLSVAYISLNVIVHSRESNASKQPAGDAVAGETKVEEVLGAASRVMLIGEAGSGKTTLLRWLAVRAARQDLPNQMTNWNNLIPFFIPMRNYIDKPLPPPQEFINNVGRNIASEMPSSWVQNLLRNGRALILVDGIDELPQGEQRQRAREWIIALTTDFPKARIVATSRPSAVPFGWLGQINPADGVHGFITAELQPMSRPNVLLFIRQWHAAVGREVQGKEERAELIGDQEALTSVLDSDRHIRSLCVSPLLCAMVCALNRERRRQLPQNRMGIYQASLDMLLDLRDRERGVRHDVGLTYEQKMVLLQDLAYFLAQNSLVSTSIDRATGQIGRTMRTLQSLNFTPEDAMQQLLERSGIVREPSTGSIDFIHRSFQEYLGAKAAAERDDIGYLIENATNDQFREIIIMSAGHAQLNQREELLQGLLMRCGLGEDVININPTWLDRTGQGLILLAIAALQNCHQLNPELRSIIEGFAERMLPPKSIEVATALAAAGDIVLDGLTSRQPTTTAEAIASIRLITLIGVDAGLQVIAEIAKHHVGIESEITRAWTFFNPVEYAQSVLPRVRAGRHVTLKDPTFLPLITYYRSLQSMTIDGNSWLEHLANLPKRPEALKSAKIKADHLRTITGIEAFTGIKILDLDLGDCSPDLTPLENLYGLEKIRISTSHVNVLNLRPLASLKQLQVVQLWQPQSYHFQLGPLTDSDIEVHVTRGREVKGLRDKISTKCRIMRSQSFPSIMP